MTDGHGEPGDKDEREWSSMKSLTKRNDGQNKMLTPTEESPHPCRREEGFAMLFVIFTIMIIGILGAMILLYTTLVLRNSVGITPASRALTAAETGLDVAHAMLAAETITDTTTIPTGSMWDGKGTYDVTVEKNPNMGDGDPYDWRITSSGEYTEYIEGVPRTFYRELEEVITFAGGRYYNALDYVLFSKEGDIEIDLDGDLGFLASEVCEINGNVYAGGDITLTDAMKLAGENVFEINGDVITERGDVLASNRSVAFASSDLEINGDIFSGILAGPGDVGGGVSLETDLGVVGGGNVQVIGNINSGARLKDYNYGVRLDNRIVVLGGCTTRVAGSIKSNEDVYGENRVFVAGTPTLDIDGTIHCGADVEFRSDIAFAANARNDINGSIYAAGDVDLFANGLVLGTLYNRVGGDIQARGNVDIYHRFSVGCGNPSGYVVGGDIYGQNVNLYSYLGAAGTLNNSVVGNIYCDGGYFDSYNRSGSFATARITIGGSVYSEGTFNMDSIDGGMFNQARTFVNGGVAVPGGLPGAGVFSNSTMTLTASGGSGSIDINNDARRLSGTPSTSGDVDIGGDTSPLASGFSVPAPEDPLPPEDYNEVLMPQCDFDYYREMAKEQEDIDGQQHYWSGDAVIDIPVGGFTSSTHVVFVDGDMQIGTVDIPAATKGVFVATGNITLRDVLRTDPGFDECEFQLISNGKVDFGPGFNFDLDDGDRMFIYAAHEDYDPNDPDEDTSVIYELGWFRDVEGQITARGTIEISSNPFAFQGGLYNHRISFRNPSVRGEAFRIPFTVKYWKEK